MSHYDFAFSSRLVFRLRQTSLRWALTFFLGIGAFFCMALPAWADAGQQPWNLLERGAQIPQLSSGRSAVVFLKLQREGVAEDSETNRILAAGNGETVSVFIDGSYHTSLPRASWAYAEVCPGAHFLNAVPDKAALAVQENIPAGQRYEFVPASTSYFQLLDDENGRPRLQAVDPDAAKVAVGQLPKAAHTISRLPTQKCAAYAEATPPPVQAPPPPVLQTSYVLQSAALFEHGKSTIDSLRKGRIELDRIIQDARANHSVVESIEIKGYADPTGRAEYNLNLSRARAQTIAQSFIGAGFSKDIVTARGMGATDLVVPDCSARLKSRQQINACNEPNRRVEMVMRVGKSVAGLPAGQSNAPAR